MAALGLPKVKGFLGEMAVRAILTRLDKEKYRVFNDLMIPTVQDKTSQIDHIVVSMYGIFVIETKNYKGWITGNENSSEWTQTIFRHKERFLNPLIQNRGHVKALKGILKDFNDIEYHPIVVFGTRAQLKVKVVSDVVYSVRLLHAIKKYDKKVVSKEDVNKICEKLKSLNITDANIKREHVKVIKHDIAERNQKIGNNVCPNCGGSLIDKKWNNKVFKACNNYPKCRFTKNIASS